MGSAAGGAGVMSLGEERRGGGIRGQALGLLQMVALDLCWHLWVLETGRCAGTCLEGRDPPAVTRSSTSRCQALERRADSSSSAATLLPCPSTFLSPVLVTSTWGPRIWAGFSWTWFLLERQLQNVLGTRSIFLCCGDLWARSRSFLFVGRSREMCQL